MSWATTANGGDFDIYLQAARDLVNRKNIYYLPYTDGPQYYYSVLFALILAPVAEHIFIVEFLWSIFSLLLLFRIFKIISDYLPVAAITNRSKNWWIAGTVFLSAQFILYNVQMIQVTLFLLWAMLEAFKLSGKNKQIAAGILLGFVINIKLMPIIVLGYFFYRNYHKVWLSSSISFMIFLFVPALCIGFDYNNFLLNEWWHLINPANKEHMFEPRIGTHSIVALLPVYLTALPNDIPYTRNIFNLSAAYTAIVVNAARLLLVALSIFIFKQLPFTKTKSATRQLYEYSYFLILIPLLMPHQQKYNFILVLPAVSYLLFFFIAAIHNKTLFRFRWCFFVFCLSMLFYSPLYGSDIIGKFMFQYTQHFRFLTWATLAMIPILIYCSPNKLRLILSQDSENTF